jgi:plastocyanin
LRTRTITVGLLAALFLLPSASLGDTFRVKAVDGDDFRPKTRTVAKGDKVIWKNVDDSPHTVTSYGSNWSKDTFLPAGERTDKKFRKRGTFKYRCELHSDLDGGQCDGMCGKIVVE